MGRNRRLMWGLPLVALALLLSACAANAPQDTLDPAGPVAREIDNLFMPVFWIAVAVFVFVEGLLVYALYRFRHRPNRPVPVQVHGNKRLEIAWTLAPALLLGVIAIPTMATIFSLAGRPPGNVLDVKVVAHQFWWEAQYPGLDVVTANEIHIPVDRPVYLQLESVDVIHSFWVPRLAGKQDVVPGQTNELTIQADEPGTYLAQCAEYCGASHANMRFRVVAQDAAAFNAWVADQRAPAAQPPEDVLAIMQRGDIGCGGCHSIRGVEGFAGTIGPDLTHFGSRKTLGAGVFRNDEEKLALWLANTPALKPGVDMPDLPLSDEEVRALVAYLQGLT